MLQKREPEIFLHNWKTRLSEVTGEKDNVSPHVMHQYHTMCVIEDTMQSSLLSDSRGAAALAYNLSGEVSRKSALIFYTDGSRFHP